MSPKQGGAGGGRPGKGGDERLADWVDGTMSPKELERFEAELRVNKSLRERAEAYRTTVEAVQGALREATAESERAPSGFADRFMAGLESGAAGAGPAGGVGAARPEAIDTPAASAPQTAGAAGGRILRLRPAIASGIAALLLVGVFVWAEGVDRLQVGAPATRDVVVAEDALAPESDRPLFRTKNAKDGELGQVGSRAEMEFEQPKAAAPDGEAALRPLLVLDPEATAATEKGETNTRAGLVLRERTLQGDSTQGSTAKRRVSVEGEQLRKLGRGGSGRGGATPSGSAAKGGVGSRSRSVPGTPGPAAGAPPVPSEAAKSSPGGSVPPARAPAEGPPIQTINPGQARGADKGADPVVEEQWEGGVPTRSFEREEAEESASELHSEVLARLMGRLKSVGSSSPWGGVSLEDESRDRALAPDDLADGENAARREGTPHLNSGAPALQVGDVLWVSDLVARSSAYLGQTATSDWASGSAGQPQAGGGGAGDGARDGSADSRRAERAGAQQNPAASMLSCVVISLPPQPPIVAGEAGPPSAPPVGRYLLWDRLGVGAVLEAAPSSVGQPPRPSPAKSEDADLGDVSKSADGKALVATPAPKLAFPRGMALSNLIGSSLWLLDPSVLAARTSPGQVSGGATKAPADPSALGPAEQVLPWLVSGPIDATTQLLRRVGSWAGARRGRVAIGEIPQSLVEQWARVSGAPPPAFGYRADELQGVQTVGDRSMVIVFRLEVPAGPKAQPEPVSAPDATRK